MRREKGIKFRRRKSDEKCRIAERTVGRAGGGKMRREKGGRAFLPLSIQRMDYVRYIKGRLRRRFAGCGFSERRKEEGGVSAEVRDSPKE